MSLATEVAETVIPVQGPLQITVKLTELLPSKVWLQLMWAGQVQKGKEENIKIWRGTHTRENCGFLSLTQFLPTEN